MFGRDVFAQFVVVEAHVDAGQKHTNPQHRRVHAPRRRPAAAAAEQRQDARQFHHVIIKRHDVTMCRRVFVHCDRSVGRHRFYLLSFYFFLSAHSPPTHVRLTEKLMRLTRVFTPRERAGALVQSENIKDEKYENTRLKSRASFTSRSLRGLGQ